MSSSQFKQVEIQNKQVEIALEVYKLDNGGYPATSEGLKALVQEPDDERQSNTWNGPYLETLATDPWGNEFQCAFPGKQDGDATQPDMWSLGPDGKENPRRRHRQLGNEGGFRCRSCRHRSIAGNKAHQA